MYLQAADIKIRRRVRWKFFSCPSQGDLEVQAECAVCDDSTASVDANDLQCVL